MAGVVISPPVKNPPFPYDADSYQNQLTTCFIYFSVKVRSGGLSERDID